MNSEFIERFLRTDQLRKRLPDKERVKSMIELATINMNVVKTIPLSDKSAILVFRETYESIRQLGDARWWTLGYEPRNHEVSMEILKELDIKEKIRLNHLNRLKNIRNDANYRGVKVSTNQAQEILEFWNVCSDDIISILLKELK